MSVTSRAAKAFYEEKVTEDYFLELERKVSKITIEARIEAAATDHIDGFPVETFEKLTNAGLLEAVIPENFGGKGLGITAGTTYKLLKLLKQLGYGNLVVGRIFEGHFNAWQLICEYGQNNQINKIADAAREYKHLFGVWNTEAGNGIRLISGDENNFYVQGAKTFASGVGFVNRPIVTGKLPDNGWQMFVAPMDKIEPEIDNSWWKPLGMKSSRSFRVDFSGVKIDRENFIGKADDYYRQPFFSGGAIRFAAVQLGAAELLFDLTREFLRELNRTEDAFQQMRLGEMAIAVESGNLWLAGAAKQFDQYLSKRDGQNLDSLLHYAGMMRTAVEQICQNVMLNCERSIGSRGLMKPYHFERVMRDLTMYLRQAAPDATLTGIGNFALKSEKTSRSLWQDDDE